MAIKIKTTFFFILLSTFVAADSAIPFWTESFDSGLPSNWTTADLQGGDIVWEQCNFYPECAPLTPALDGSTFYFGADRFETNSFENGYAYLAPALMGGIVDEHSCFLATSSINCENKSQVFLQFNSLIIGGSSEVETNAIVQVKVGGGDWTNDFTVFHNLNSDLVEEGPFGLQSYNPHTSWLDLSSVAANQDDVQIRWIWNWTGAGVFYWGIDDIELLDENPIYDRTVWGEQSGEGDFNGSLGGWTVVSQSDCSWIWDEAGLIDVPDTDLLADFYTASPTVHNGVVMINASSCFPEPSNAELISPTIDLTNVLPGTLLSLSFHQTGALGNPSVVNGALTRMMVSVDGGQSYIDTVNVNPEKVFLRSFNETKTIPLPLTATGAPQLKIKFVFDGFDIAWVIDDVRIVERFENDLAIRPVFYSIAPNYSTPAGAIQPFGFAAEVENVGSTLQDFANLYVTVMEEETLIPVFQDTLLLGTIEPGERTDGLSFEKRFTPPDHAANYICKYYVSGSQPDGNLNDNVKYWKFEVTDSVFSKNRSSAYINAGFRPFDDFKYEIGNCFFIPKGSSLKASEIRFAFHNPNSLVGTTLLTNLYKWKTDDTFADANGDTLANDNEIILVANNLFEVIDEVNGGENVRTVFSRPIDFENEIILEDSTYYILTVQYKDLITTGGGQTVPFFIAGSEQLDYSSMFWQSFQTAPPQYVSMLRLGDDDFFRANSWGLKRIPFIQLVVSDYVNDVKEEAPEIEISVFPNPVSDEMLVELGDYNLDKGAYLEIIDIWGHRLLTRQIERGNVSKIPIVTSNLSNGSYILRVVSGESYGSTKFTVINERR